MTDAELYGFIVNVALITGCVFLVISVILFFRLKIMKVIGDLTGRSARKGVKLSKEDVKKRKEQEQEFARRRQAIVRSNQARVSSRLGKIEKMNDETSMLEHDVTIMLSPDRESSGQQTELLGGTETQVLSDSDRRKIAEEFGMIIEDDVTVVNTDVIIN